MKHRKHQKKETGCTCPERGKRKSHARRSSMIRNLNHDTSRSMHDAPAFPNTVPTQMQPAYAGRLPTWSTYRAADTEPSSARNQALFPPPPCGELEEYDVSHSIPRHWQHLRYNIALQLNQSANAREPPLGTSANPVAGVLYVYSTLHVC